MIYLLFEFYRNLMFPIESSFRLRNFKYPLGNLYFLWKKYFPMEFYLLKVNISHDRWESLINEMVITLKVTLKVIIYHRTYLNFSIDAPKTGTKMQSYHRHTFVLSDIVLKPNWLIYIICGHTCLPFSFMVLIELFIHLNKTFVFNIINVSKVYCS